MSDFDHSIPIAEELGDHFFQAWNSVEGGYAHYMGGDRNGILLSKEGLRELEDRGYTIAMSCAYTFLGEPLFLDGQTEAAVNLARRSISLGETRDNFGHRMAYRILAMCAAHEIPADWGTAQENIQTSIRQAEELGSRPDQAIGHFRYAEILHKKGDLDGAREQLDQAEGLFRDMGMDWWTGQAVGLRGRIDRGEPFVWFAPYVDGPPAVDA